MRLVGERLQRICHPHEIVPTLEGVSRRMPRAAVGVQARDVEPGQPSLLEGALEFGVQERAVGLLAQHDVAGLGCESRDDLGVPTACHGVRRPLPELAVARRVGVGRVHDRHADAPRRRKYNRLLVTGDQGISNTFPEVLRPSNSRCASAACASGSSRSMRCVSFPILIQPSTSPARASRSARVAM